MIKLENLYLATIIVIIMGAKTDGLKFGDNKVFIYNLKVSLYKIPINYKRLGKSG